MGRWGSGLFQGDTDLDVISDIGYEMGLEDDLYFPENREKILKELNDGLLADKLDKLSTQADNPRYWGAEYKYVLLCAAAMGLGAIISKRHMSELAHYYKNADNLLEEGKKEIAKALKEYPNDGTPYNVAGPGLLETVNINHAKEIRSKTKWECLRKCWWCQKDEDDNEKLVKCAACDIALYCNKECQDEGFPIHEEECKGETKINADGIKVFANKAEHDVPLRN